MVDYGDDDDDDYDFSWFLLGMVTSLGLATLLH